MIFSVFSESQRTKSAREGRWVNVSSVKYGADDLDPPVIYLTLRLLITLANSLDPDQRQTVGPRSE